MGKDSPTSRWKKGDLATGGKEKYKPLEETNVTAVSRGEERGGGIEYR